jgi:hypothetical protein
MADITIRTHSASAAKEIKASAHYAYVVNGITLDGSKFATGELVTEGQCLVMDDTSGKYEKYTESTPGTFEPGKSNPVILDESVKFTVDDEGNNPDVTVGQVIVHGAVHAGMLTGVTDEFKKALAGSVRFV